ncbi:hypothetical protein BC938DRAFT_474554 [Jimgerdemannia flammicorona]|uniref:Uncharacterized protein n=1 Tax=Jimgerdemannia flammicorona TaxID=994334 RepID=A0A433QSF3_9FUNG|nr:hypothetical protein BC938DRAFT_474554 [Jimgerdemannia flammicorona]
MLEMRSVMQHTNPHHHAPLWKSRVREEYFASLVDVCHQPQRHCVSPFTVHLLALSLPTEREDRNLRLRHSLNQRNTRELLPSPPCKVPLLVEITPESSQAVHLERQPDTEPPDRAIAEGGEHQVVFFRVLRSREVLAIYVGERVPEVLGISDEQEPGPMGEKEAFVQVQRDRIATLNPTEKLAAPVRHYEAASIACVDMEPHLGVLLDHVCDSVEVIHGTCIGRPSVRNDEEWGPTVGDIICNHGLQDFNLHPERCPVCRDASDVFGGDSRGDASPHDAHVGLIRGVGNGAGETLFLGETATTSADSRAPVGRRAARAEGAKAGGGIADKIGEPLYDVGLQLDHARRADPYTDLRTGNSNTLTRSARPV